MDSLILARDHPYDISTGEVAYSDTGYSDTVYIELFGYSDTFLISQFPIL